MKYVCRVFQVIAWKDKGHFFSFPKESYDEKEPIDLIHLKPIGTCRYEKGFWRHLLNGVVLGRKTSIRAQNYRDLPFSWPPAIEDVETNWRDGYSLPLFVASPTNIKVGDVVEVDISIVKKNDASEGNKQ